MNLTKEQHTLLVSVLADAGVVCQSVDEWDEEAVKRYTKDLNASLKAFVQSFPEEEMTKLLYGMLGATMVGSPK